MPAGAASSVIVIKWPLFITHVKNIASERKIIRLARSRSIRIREFLAHCLELIERRTENVHSLLPPPEPRQESDQSCQPVSWPFVWAFDKGICLRVVESSAHICRRQRVLLRAIFQDQQRAAEVHRIEPKNHSECLEFHSPEKRAFNQSS